MLLRYEALFTNMSKNLFSVMNCPISYSVDGLTEGSKNVRRVSSLFFLVSTQTLFRPYHNTFAFPPRSQTVTAVREKQTTSSLSFLLRGRTSMLFQGKQTHNMWYRLEGIGARREKRKKKEKTTNSSYIF